MYRFSIFLLFIALPCIAFAQPRTVNIIYFDAHWKETTKDNASYYREIQKQEDQLYYAVDHYLNGNVQMTGHYLSYPEDDNYGKSGKFVYYDSLGFIEHEERYANNIRQGVWKYYYPHSNHLGIKKEFSDGASRVAMTLYDTMGYKVGEAYFLHDKRDSVWHSFFPSNGSIKSTTIFKDDMKEGPYTEYNEYSHNVTVKGKYLHDKRTGAWGFYTSSGEIYQIVNFKDGLEDGTATYYDSSSHKKRIEANFQNGKKEGTATYSLPNGQRSIVMNFKDDKLNGDQTIYYPNGNVQRIEHYENGILSGGKCFDESGAIIPYFPSDRYNLSVFNDLHILQPDETSIGNSKSDMRSIRQLSRNDTTYYSIDGDKTEWNYADYYRVIYANPTDTGYKLEERYIVRNRLKFSAYTISPDPIVFNGAFFSFDKKGYKEDEGEYDHGKPTGIYKEYYPGTDTLWDQIVYGKDGAYSLISYYRDGKVKRRQDSVVGQNVGGVCYDESGKEIPFTPFRLMPKPSADMSYFLSQNLHYPEAARDNGIQGRVVLKFVVLKDGTISKLHLIHRVGGGCDEEAMRVLLLMPKWEPGTKDGEPIDVYFTLPISFRLE